MTLIKICGLAREEDLLLAVELGVDYVGFVRESASPRVVSAEAVGRLSRLVPPPVKSVSVYGRFPKGETVVTDLVQAVEFEEVPESGLLLAVRFCGPDPEPPGAQVHGIVVDSFVPGSFGGTGVPADWDRIARDFPRGSAPLILAGGLTPENVATAIRIVRPDGVDVSSGIEVSPGVKDHAKMREFVRAVREA